MTVRALELVQKVLTTIGTQDFTSEAVSSDASEPAVRVAMTGNPLRVLHVLNRLERGGTELVVLKLLGGLSESKFQQRLAAIRGMDPQLQRVSLAEHLVSVGDGGSGFQFPLFRLASIMRAYRPHIVHSRNWGAIEAIPAARLAGVPVAIHSEHGYEIEMLAGLPIRRRIFRRAAYAMVDAVVAVTRELGDYHARMAWLSPARISVIYNGVDTQQFYPSPEARTLLRKRFGLPENRFIVGTVGRMVPIKDHPTLLRAMEILVQHGVNAHALLVGSGPELEGNKSIVTASPNLAGRVTFTGSSEEVPDLLRTIDAFALPSISEGMSNTLLEAMATGLPVIATSVGGNIEVVEHERSGWLIDTRDAEALASHLATLASTETLRAQYGAAARKRVIERFSLERMLEGYSNLYRELAARRGIKALAR
jgi:sugar transferase (PEP-CTERM/EpsH1 system associated)